MFNPLGACSWSLCPDSPEGLVHALRACDLARTQLSLDPIRTGDWPLEATRRALTEARIEVPSAMIAMRGEDYSTIESIRLTGGLRPDEHWPANLAAARESAAIANTLGIPLVTFHAGFLPESLDDPLRGRMIERIATVAGIFADQDIGTALETGQESAATLMDVLADPRLARVRVNFDPANMILYASADPIEALALLAPRVAQLHLKDALPPPAPGAWGTETPLGEGSVDWPRLFDVVRAHLPDVALIIERESGNDRAGDVRRGADFAETFGATR